MGEFVLGVQRGSIDDAIAQCNRSRKNDRECRLNATASIVKYARCTERKKRYRVARKFSKATRHRENIAKPCGKK
jgi:hypothetical protein